MSSRWGSPLAKADNSAKIRLITSLVVEPLQVHISSSRALSPHGCPWWSSASCTLQMDWETTRASVDISTK